MRLTVSIVNWNTTGLLIKLLESLARFPAQGGMQVVVADNNSDDFDERAVRAAYDDVYIIRNSENLGYAHGNNQAFAVAQGEFVLLLNPDTEATEGAIDAMIALADYRSDAAAIGAKLVRPDGSIDRSVRSFPYPFAIACEFVGLARLFPKSRLFAQYRMNYFDYNAVMEVDQPMGSCLLLRKSVIDRIGGMDEDFPIFFNEVDWLYRAKTGGWHVYFLPDAVFMHVGGAGTGKAPRAEMVRESHDSLIRFYEKHFRKVMNPVSYRLMILFINIGRRLRGGR